MIFPVAAAENPEVQNFSMKRMRLAAVTIAGFLSGILAANPIMAGDWLNWRGPFHNGSSDEKGFPEKFSKDKNIRWVADLPGTGESTPIVVGDSVFLTAAVEEEGGVIAICLDRGNGEIKWRKKFGEEVRRDERSTFAGPSATSDGKIVVFLTGNGSLAAFDLKGTLLWSRNLREDHGEFAFQWTFSSSPLLFREMLYLQVLQRNEPVSGRGRAGGLIESFLLALDPETGKDLWRHVRPSQAVQESLEAFSTPVPLARNGRIELLIVGGDCLTGHDSETGKEFWRWGTWNPRQIGHWRLVPSPVYGGGVVLACAPKGSPVYAVKAGGEGMLNESSIAWSSGESEVNSDVPTPLFYDGRFYVLNDRNKFISCVEPETGRIVWSERLDAKVKLESSPTGADGKIYLMSHLGEVFVVKAGDRFELLNQTQLGEMQSTNIRASIVPANRNLLIRTDSKLFCVGK